MDGITSWGLELTDNELIRLFLPLIKAGLTTYGYTTATVLQGNQPTKQGTDTEPSVHFYKIGDKRIGHPQRKSTWNDLMSVMTDTDIQIMEATWQISTLVRQPNTYTASDLANVVAMIMQTSKFIEALKASGVGILRIGEVRNPYLQDDRDQYQASPSFDFIISYSRNLSLVGAKIDAIEFDAKRV
jgi:hypothetical protein